MKPLQRFLSVEVCATKAHLCAASKALSATIVALIAFSVQSALAQDHHPLHKDFYHHWKAPDNPAASCCNARLETPEGGQIGDCEPTAARIVGGNWQAWVRQWGIWIPIPDAKILREKNPNIFDGHLCWQPERGVICFLPPNTGG